MNPKPDKFIPALYGGIIMAVISATPFLNLINCLCCAGLLFGGIMGVFFYKNNFTPDTPPFSAGDCMAVGALAGVVSAFIGTGLSLVFLSIFGNVMGEFIIEALRNSNLSFPEGTFDEIERIFRSGGSIFFAFVELMQSLVLDTLFGLLGGLIGYSIFKSKQSASGGPLPPMPQPPPAPATAV